MKKIMSDKNGRAFPQMKEKVMSASMKF